MSQIYSTTKGPKIQAKQKKRTLDKKTAITYTDIRNGAAWQRSAPKYELKELTAKFGRLGGYFFL